MNGLTWQDANILICVVTMVIAVFLSVYALRRRQVPGALWFGGLVGIIGWVNFWYALEAAAGDNLAAYITFSKFEYIGLTFTPLFWLGFALNLRGRERPFRPAVLLALAAIPLQTIILAFTNEWHGLIWAAPAFQPGAYAPVFTSVYGAGFWVYTIYAYVVFLVGSVLLVHRAIGRWNVYRSQAVLFLLATVMPWVSNLIEIFDHLNPLPGVYLNAVFFCLCMLLFWFALFRLRLLDLVPLAHETILNNVPDAIFVVDVQDRLVALNARVRRYMANPARDPIGRPFKEVFPRFAADFDALAGIFEIQTERQIDDRIVELRISPLLNPQGARRGRLFVLTDVTARVRAEQAQRSHADELARRIHLLTLAQQVYREIGFSFDGQHLLDNALDAMLRLSLADAGCILLMKDNHLEVVRSYGEYTPDGLARLLGDDISIIHRARLGERALLWLPPQTVVSALPGIRAQMALPLFQRLGNPSAGLHGMILLETRQIERFTDDRFQLLVLIADRMAAALENTRLMDAVKARAAELETLYAQVSELEQLKSDMMRVAAHDLKNPLGVLMGYLSILEATPDLPGGSVPMIEAMSRSLNRIENIVDNFLSLERAEEIAQKQTMKLFDLRTLVDRLHEEFAPPAAEKHQQVELALPTAPCFVRADQAQLYEAASNFVSNAIKYTPTQGSIRIQLSRSEYAARLEVIDTGYGIPADRQGRLFEPFYRVETDETAEIDGTGLGLHLTKKIIERCGGTLVFHSVYRQGSTFGFEIPLDTLPDFFADLPDTHVENHL